MLLLVLLVEKERPPLAKGERNDSKGFSMGFLFLSSPLLPLLLVDDDGKEGEKRPPLVVAPVGKEGKVVEDAAGDAIDANFCGLQCFKIYSHKIL